MPSSDLVALAILPVVVWISFLFVLRSTSAAASKLRATWTARTKRDLMDGSRLWALFVFIQFSVVIVLVLGWTRVEGFDAAGTVLNAVHWVRNTLEGVVLGIALLGLLLVLRSHFPQARKFGLVIMAGVASPPSIRISTIALGVLAEELWRTVCLKALLADRISGPRALIVTSVAYGFTYLMWGSPLALSEVIMGAALGGLFLWSGSLFVPLAAHFILSAQLLVFMMAVAPDAELGDIHTRPFATCPACGSSLGLRQVSLNPSETFVCPTCQARLTMSDRTRAFVRWGFTVLYTICLFASWEIFPDLMRGKNYWIMLATIPFAGIGLRSFLQIAFPPKLECGDSDFLRLGLDRRGDAHSAEKEHDELDKRQPL